jgi:nucleoside-diphosphate-sugar epimerase
MIMKSLFIQNVVSHLECEAMISSYCHLFDISSVVVRLANVVKENIPVPKPASSIFIT